VCGGDLGRVGGVGAGGARLTGTTGGSGAPARLPTHPPTPAPNLPLPPLPPDIYLPSGKQGIVKGYKAMLGYQPRWDMYGRMLQNLTTRVPMMTSTGNHDMEFQPDGTVFAAYNTR
jgi:hypothetical protein